MPVVILSMLVVLLSGIALFQGFQLRVLKRRLKEAESVPLLTESTQADALRQKREEGARLCMELKRTLTHIHTTIPSAVPGLSIERISLLCSDALKEKVNILSNMCRTGLSDRLAGAMDERDLEQFDELLSRLFAIAEEVKGIDRTLAALFAAWSNNSLPAAASCEQTLTALLLRLDELQEGMKNLFVSAARKSGSVKTAPSVQERLRRAAGAISHPEIGAALAELEDLTEKHYEALDRQTKGRIESYYLPTLELVLEELHRAERAGEDTDTRAQLSIRVIQVLANIITDGQQVRNRYDTLNLEAEVVAMERLAALRGDITDGVM